MCKICVGNTQSRRKRKKNWKESEKRKTERRNGDNKRSKSFIFTFFRPGYLSSILLSETDCIVCHKERFNGFICIVFILGAALFDLCKCQIMPYVE